MILRLSQKLAIKVRTTPGQVLALDPNPFADWSAALFTADRAQYVMLTNTASLYTTIIHGQDISSDSRLLNRGLSALHELMADDRLEFIYQRLIAPSTAIISFSKALNRSVTGSMNELVSHAKLWLTEGDLSPFGAASKLNEMPMSTISYANPREALKSLGKDPRQVAGGLPRYSGQKSCRNGDVGDDD